MLALLLKVTSVVVSKKTCYCIGEMEWVWENIIIIKQ